MKEQFEMVAKTFQGLEDVLAEELRGLGAENVEPGRRMVSFEGDLEMLYGAASETGYKKLMEVMEGLGEAI